MRTVIVVLCLFALSARAQQDHTFQALVAENGSKGFVVDWANTQMSDDEVLKALHPVLGSERWCLNGWVIISIHREAGGVVVAGGCK